MKFKDIVEACGSRLNWIKPEYSWKLDGDRVVPVPEVEITLDTEVHVEYFWYDHLNPVVRESTANDDIMAHDWEKYQEWRKLVDEDNPYNGLCYFPNEACISTDDGFFGRLFLGNEKVFNLITYSEHECG